MPTPAMGADSPEVIEAWEAYQAEGGAASFGAKKRAADKLGLHFNTFTHRLSKYVDPAVRDSMGAVGTGMVPALVWAKTKSADGTSYSTLLKPEKADDNPQALADAIREALEGVSAPVAPDKPPLGKDLCAVFPVADLHMGLLTDAEEVGEDWDSKTSLKVFKRTFSRLVDITPSGDVAVLAQLGDLTHTDDQRNVTPQHGHQLDADTRYFMILRRAVEAMKWAIEALRRNYGKVIYRGCRGNHDLHAHYAVTLALAEYYRDCGDVEIIESAQDIFAWDYGATMLVLHHGDKAKPERLAPLIPAQWREMWSRTTDCLVLSGHIHHQKAQEIGGIMFESVGTIIPRDAHAFSHGYTAKRSLVSIVLDREEGEVSRARVKV